MHYYAHSAADQLQPPPLGWQPLSAHLTAVARLARSMAAAARPRDGHFQEAAHFAGLLHDLGKYRPEFQQMLLRERGKSEVTRHKQAGAALAGMPACAGWDNQMARLDLAFAIAGHHGGLPNHAELKSLIRGPGGQDVARQVWPAAIADCNALNNPFAAWQYPDTDKLLPDLLTRLLFSCLVDADWQDTGAHSLACRGQPLDPPAEILNPQGLLTVAQRHIADRAESCRNATLKIIRQQILDAALEAAALSPGLFSLTVPTGGGKTLSGLAFALSHAAQYGLRRIIYVAPYLSIIEQNARVIREALAVDQRSPFVFEHHSLADPPGDENKDDTGREAAVRRAENWDSPVVVATNVQFFESLFANQPGRCRKLHNIARSVVILDECQTLPPDLAAPTCGMLRQVAQELGSTIVLCTATQPAFNHAALKAEERLDAREIIPPQLDLFRRLQRVTLTWRTRPDEALDWPQTASVMLAEAKRWPDRPAALCVVNSRRAARELFAELQQHQPTGVYHLSTSMCAAHRLAVLDIVRERLDKRLPCYLVTTQLIEAGVDVDFPVVLRELAPLEAIIQAAGRCNREGLLNTPDGAPGGRVIIFRSRASIDEPQRYYPCDEWYKKGRAIVENNFLNVGHVPSIDNPGDILEYFTWLYHTGELDKAQIQSLRSQLNFPEVASAYRLVDDDSVPVVVATWEERRAEVQLLLDAVREAPSRTNFRRLAPFQVNLRRHELSKAAANIARVDERLELFVWYGTYEPSAGLSHEQSDALLIV